MRVSSGFLSILVVALASANPASVAADGIMRFAQAPAGNFYGGYGGFDPITRPEIDPKASRQLLGRLDSLGYMRWLVLIGVFKPEKPGGRFKIEVTLDYKGGRDRRLPAIRNMDAYFAKIALLASELFDVGVDEILVTLGGVRCPMSFHGGAFASLDRCSEGDARNGPPIAGLANDIHGDLPEGVGMAEIAGRVEAYLRGLGARTKSWISYDNVLVRADGLVRAVAKDEPGPETVVLYLVGEAGPVPGYYLVADGGRQAERGAGASGPTAFVPFEPERFKDLDALARRVAAHISTTPGAR